MHNALRSLLLLFVITILLNEVCGKGPRDEGRRADKKKRDNESVFNLGSVINELKNEWHKEEQKPNNENPDVSSGVLQVADEVPKPILAPDPAPISTPEKFQNQLRSAKKSISRIKIPGSSPSRSKRSISQYSQVPSGAAVSNSKQDWIDTAPQFADDVMNPDADDIKGSVLMAIRYGGPKVRVIRRHGPGRSPWPEPADPWGGGCTTGGCREKRSTGGNKAGENSKDDPEVTLNSKDFLSVLKNAKILYNKYSEHMVKKGQPAPPPLEFVEPSEADSKHLEVIENPPEIDTKPSEVDSKATEVDKKPQDINSKTLEPNNEPPEVNKTPQEGSSKTPEADDKPSEVKSKDVDKTPSEANSKEANDKPSEVKSITSDVDNKPQEAISKVSEAVKKPPEVNGKTPEADNKPSEVKSKDTDNKPQEANSKASEAVKKPSEVNGKTADVDNKPSEVKNKDPDKKPSEAKSKASAAKPLEVKSKTSDINNKPTEVNNKASEAAKKQSEANSKTPEVDNNPSEVKNKDVDKKPSEVSSKSSEAAKKPSEVKSKTSDVDKKPLEANNKASTVVGKPSEVNGKTVEVVKKPAEVNEKSPNDNKVA